LIRKTDGAQGSHLGIIDIGNYCRDYLARAHGKTLDNKRFQHIMNAKTLQYGKGEGEEGDQ